MHDAPLTFEQLDEIEAELRDPTSIVGLPFVIYGDHERWEPSFSFDTTELRGWEL